MGKIIKKYTNGEITVVWKPDLCIHATNCFSELPKVFIPYERPWIRMDGAGTDEIIDTVGHCPTEALTYYRNNEEPFKNGSKGNAEISILKNGPYLIKGYISLKDTDGNEIVTGKTTALCRCGNSKNRPFCDGSHTNADFKLDDSTDYTES